MSEPRISVVIPARNEAAVIGPTIDQARRGWLEASDVINTRSLAQLRKLSKR